MTRFNSVVREIAKEFGFAPDELHNIVKPEKRQGNSITGMQSLFDDDQFATADRRYEVIHRILSDAKVAINMPPGIINEQGIEDLVDRNELSEKLISRFRDAVDEMPRSISLGFGDLLGRFLEACIQAHMVNELYEITSISVKWLLKGSIDPPVVRLTTIALISMSRSWVIINYEQRSVLHELVKQLFSKEELIKLLNEQNGKRSKMSRWQQILREEHDSN
jgi:hypothetical protein